MWRKFFFTRSVTLLISIGVVCHASARFSNSGIEYMSVEDCNPKKSLTIVMPLPFGLLFGSVFETPRIGFFLGFAALRQEPLYGPPDFLRARALIGTPDEARNRSRFARRRRDAKIASLACPAVAMGGDSLFQTVGLRFADPARIEEKCGDFVRREQGRSHRSPQRWLKRAWGFGFTRLLAGC